MTPEQRAAADDTRAALALIAAVADRRDGDVDAILGRDWLADRHAALAWITARWVVVALRQLGVDAAELAREVIGDSVAAEAREAGP